ncbi:MAG: hypothetical protein A2057_03345 [Ignavibacteria bacterium GWA2_35_9]|nr:MAG: hypothetical protein A2057_03345 [Ignavibacteria bacterium GWA2_35_9]OGU46272.1 MAG: hypothetical protein A2000_03450 [Ignavibacteria bacterium GWB2_36_8]OGU51265.1 MAG: hypothetical protein A2080_04525 [Ignavibacteria bacterium GWC2_36_12]OGV00404.1 MAG: hypothetical protein A2330_01590 [Ignavibacteria bacterium RIFOXYB2_FULL_36_7]
MMNLVRILIIVCQIIFPGFVSFDLFNIFYDLYGIIPALQFTLCYLFYCLFHILLKEKLPPYKKNFIVISKIIFLLVLMSNAYFVFGLSVRFTIFSIMLIMVEMVIYISDNGTR